MIRSLHQSLSAQPKKPSPKWRSQFGFWLGLAVILGLAVWLRLPLLERFRISYDEAIHLIWLRLLAEGYQPYREIYITYPPLYPLSIELIWTLWPTELAQRWFSIGFAVFGATGAALLARRMAGTLAGLAAATLILFSPVLLKPSREIMGEFHAIAWAVWAIFFSVAYVQATRPSRQRLWLLLSGLSLSASLLTKLLLPFVAPLIGLVIVARHWPILATPPRRIKPLLVDIGLWGIALLLPALLLLLVFFDTRALLQQVIEQRLLARDAYLAAEAGSLPGFWAYTLTFLRQDWLLNVAALAGLVIVWRDYRPYFWLLAGWLLVSIAFLAIHSPLREKHFLTLVPVLAVSGGAALGYWLAQVRQRPLSVTALAGLVLLLLISRWQVPTLLQYHWDPTTELPGPNASEAQMLAFIDEVTGPNDCLITDHTPLLYWSGRTTPPQLAEMSANRLASGALSVPELIDISEQYDCPLVAPVGNRLPEFMFDYLIWVNDNYLGRVYFEEAPIFFGNVTSQPTPAVTLAADFGGKVQFHGYSLPPAPFQAGQRLPLRLVWERQAPLEADYAIFIQLRNSQGQVVASADYQPYRGLLPLAAWPQQQPLETVTWLALPPELPSGDYQLYLGLYRPDTLERMPLTGDRSSENAIIVGPLHIAGHDPPTASSDLR